MKHLIGYKVNTISGEHTKVFMRTECNSSSITVETEGIYPWVINIYEFPTPRKLQNYIQCLLETNDFIKFKPVENLEYILTIAILEAKL